jgi:hypothetical protein
MNKIEADLFKGDKKTIDTQKVLFMIWKNRNMPSVISSIVHTFWYSVCHF